MACTMAWSGPRPPRGGAQPTTRGTPAALATSTVMNDEASMG